MIITCPECATRYKTTEDAIGPNGRTVRCANCTAMWFVPAPAGQLTMDALSLADNQRSDMTPAPEPPAQNSQTNTPAVSKANTPAPETIKPRGGAHVDMREKAEKRKRNSRLRSVLAIWLIPLSLISAAAAAAYHYRQDIVAKYPQSATFYQAVGVDVSLSGLMLDPPETRYAEIDGVPTLVVTGFVRNISGEDLPLPLVALSLHNSSGEVLTEWVVDLDTPVLPKGGKVEYLSQKPNPSLDADSLRTRFIDEWNVPTMTPLQMQKDANPEDVSAEN